jgi:hypothetical protein
MSRGASRLRLAVLTCLTLGAAVPAAGQGPSRVIGRVYDAATGSPVALAELALGDLRTTSASDGGFHFGSVPAGPRLLEVRRLGYTPWRGVVDVSPGLDREVSVALQPLAFRLDSLIVTAEPGGVAIGGRELARRGHDLGRALDGWEGVVVRRTGSGGPAAPQVRGGGPDEVLVLVDGSALNDPLPAAPTSAPSPPEVEQVTLLRRPDRADGAPRGRRAADSDLRGAAAGPAGSESWRRRRASRPRPPAALELRGALRLDSPRGA